MAMRSAEEWAKDPAASCWGLSPEDFIRAIQRDAYAAALEAAAKCCEERTRGHNYEANDEAQECADRIRKLIGGG